MGLYLVILAFEILVDFRSGLGLGLAGKNFFGQKAFCVVATNTMSRETPNAISTDIHDEIV